MGNSATQSRDPFPAGLLIVLLYAALIVLLVGSAASGEVPHSGVVREHVDVIEVCHFYTETGESDPYPLKYKPLWTQLLFRNWDYHTGEHQIVAWRLVKGFPAEDIPVEQALHEALQEEGLTDDLRAVLTPRKPRLRTSMYPEWNHARGVWQVEWIDGSAHRLITAGSLQEIQTITDPEIEERDRWPKEWRRELRKQSDLLGRKP